MNQKQLHYNYYDLFKMKRLVNWDKDKYIYHNGTNYDDSPLSAFAVNNTYYAFIDFVINPTGNMILQWTNVSTIPYGDDRILLAIIVVSFISFCFTASLSNSSIRSIK